MSGNRKDRKQKGPKLSKVEKRKQAKENKKMKNKLSKAGNAVKADMKREKGGESWAGAQHSAGTSAAIYNSEGKLVFSKFDFTEENGGHKPEGSKKAGTKDPKAALTKIQKQKDKLKSLKASGKILKLIW